MEPTTETKSKAKPAVKSAAQELEQPRQFRDVVYVQLHDAFLPIGLAGGGQLTISMSGAKAMKGMVERPNGVMVTHKGGRQFLVPYGNISFLEYAGG